MTTYRTYKETVINTMSLDIYVLDGLFCEGKDINNGDWKFAEASEHCQSLKEFLEGGGVVSSGDLMLNDAWGVWDVNIPGIYNEPDSSHENEFTYIIKTK